jgi:hypothetical protein
MLMIGSWACHFDSRFLMQTFAQRVRKSAITWDGWLRATPHSEINGLQRRAHKPMKACRHLTCYFNNRRRRGKLFSRLRKQASEKPLFELFSGDKALPFFIRVKSLDKGNTKGR